jgi:hypothetical protein
LNAPNLNPINPPGITTKAKGTKREKSNTLLIEYANKPPGKFVNIKKLVVAAACYGSVKSVSLSSDGDHIPPPIPTKPATIHQLMIRAK